ncbi:MAG: iron ABC transporter permease [Firmicutes bacterium]|nr:iron ABC transporter permease [Bacillota bacterium]
MTNYDRRTYIRMMVFGFSFLLLIIAVLLSVGFGSVKFNLEQIFNALFNSADSIAKIIIFKSRIPRALISMLVGMNLAISGALLQAVMRNPLADPGILGVSSGAALVTVTVMLVFPEYALLIPLGAFIGGTISSLVVYGLAWQRGVDPIRIVLSGVAVNAVLGAGVSLLSILYSDRIQSAMMWLNGSIAGKSWVQVRQLIPFSIVGIILAFMCVNIANTLLLGDDAARGLGIKVGTVRVVLCVIAAFLTGISVATVGIISFVGLIVPHVARLLVGSDYRFLLPVSGVMGALLLLLADVIARTVFSPLELPVGIIMAIAGGPFFIYLLRKRRSYKL